MAALISSEVWFLFIALTALVVVVVSSPTTDLLESVDCLLRDCIGYFTCYFTNADRNMAENLIVRLEVTIDSVRKSGYRPNTTHKLVIMWNVTLRVCLNRSVFLLFSLASRELSPFLLHEHRSKPLFSKLYVLSLYSLYKFHVSCFVISHFNRLPRPLFPRSSTLIVIFMIIWLVLVQLA